MWENWTAVCADTDYYNKTESLEECRWMVLVFVIIKKKHKKTTRLKIKKKKDFSFGHLSQRHCCWSQGLSRKLWLKCLALGIHSPRVKELMWSRASENIRELIHSVLRTDTSFRGSRLKAAFGCSVQKDVVKTHTHTFYSLVPQRTCPATKYIQSPVTRVYGKLFKTTMNILLVSLWGVGTGGGVYQEHLP